MIKRFWIFPLLAALVALLSACAPVLVSKPIDLGEKVMPALPTAVSMEKIVTLRPEGEQTRPAKLAASPTSRVFDEKAQEAATAYLRALLGAQQLELAFITLDRSPNASNYPAFLFADPQGNNYYVSQNTLQPIEFTLGQPIQETQGSSKTPDELRAIAEQIAKTHTTRFEEFEYQLTYSEGNKGGENSFFRWEMPDTDVGGMPAVLQIGLKQDGSLFSYLNSLDLLP